MSNKLIRTMTYKPKSLEERREGKRKSLKKKIGLLRSEHTRLFESDDPNKSLKMDMIQKKIIMHWDAWHRLG